MRLELKNGNQKWVIDTATCVDLSIAVDCQNGRSPKAWYIDPPNKSTVHLDDWIGSVAQGGHVNFNNLRINPHAHGTHTESLGHITPDEYPVEGLIKDYFFRALVVTLAPNQGPKGLEISLSTLREKIESADSEFWPKGPQAIIIRTSPNSTTKRTQIYDHKGWPYLSAEAATYLREMDIEHLLIDTPSVDPERDQGALLAHKAFWHWPESPRYGATITEFIFVPDQVDDGPYLLELQMAPIVNDASFSRPLLYQMEPLDSC